jgi:alcohol dehydrogenase class IV
VILPHAVRYNRDAASEALARVAGALGVDDPASGLFALARSIGAPASLEELGMKEDDLDEAARMSVEPPPWNPRPVEFQGIRLLLEDAYCGRDPTEGGGDG